MANITTSTKKLTKRDHFNALLAIEEVAQNPTLVEFINNELELLARKNSADKKPTAVQQANEELKEAIYNFMTADDKYTISMLIKEVPECADKSNQKVSAIVSQMVTEGKVEKVIEKRVSYFRKV
jgi:hypothetical protein